MSACSFSEVSVQNREVCFAPKNRRRQLDRPRRKSANRRHTRQENDWQCEPVHIAERRDRSTVMGDCSSLNAAHRVLTLRSKVKLP